MISLSLSRDRTDDLLRHLFLAELKRPGRPDAGFGYAGLVAGSGNTRPGKGGDGIQ
ncbi:hypothetical protein PGT21_023276 [Puccinia graminis f. sp. tritici]|uniref:Uncharacterized protein n=1 Tax=Puccinia graminis f. sp. tritici TaxID=56615 RepID=A0A5B0PDI2_PUCGR|nr:hypothetical protein PGT21_023276 [Puccinia graminis f. sp. tritici]